MNIKSELLAKKIKWFPEISVSALLASMVSAIILSMLIVFVEQGIFFKLIFLSIAIVVTLLYTYDNQRTDKEKTSALKQGFGLILTTLLFVEIPLYVVSKQTSLTATTTIISTETKDGKKIDKTCESNCEHKQIEYQVVTFYNAENNNKLGYRKMNDMNDQRVKLWDGITARETYYKYTPFIQFESDYRYVRAKK